jgi:hypothetical protein
VQQNGPTDFLKGLLAAGQQNVAQQRLDFSGALFSDLRQQRGPDAHHVFKDAEG